MSTSLPPLESISPENHGPAVIAAAYVLIVVTILFTAIRLGTTFSLKRGFGYDDAFLVFAAVRPWTPISLLKAMWVTKRFRRSLLSARQLCWDERRVLV